jgi:hypothetical protein
MHGFQKQISNRIINTLFKEEIIKTQAVKKSYQDNKAKEYLKTPVFKYPYRKFIQHQNYKEPYGHIQSN